jgi:hypothetical protein
LSWICFMPAHDRRGFYEWAAKETAPTWGGRDLTDRDRLERAAVEKIL